MKAKDIMTIPVFTVAPDTPVLDIAGLLFERQISAVPVVEDGRVVGLVSEGDLLTDARSAPMAACPKLRGGIVCSRMIRRRPHTSSRTPLAQATS